MAKDKGKAKAGSLFASTTDDAADKERWAALARRATENLKAKQLQHQQSAATPPAAPSAPQPASAENVTGDMDRQARRKAKKEAKKAAKKEQQQQQRQAPPTTTTTAAPVEPEADRVMTIFEKAQNELVRRRSMSAQAAQSAPPVVAAASASAPAPAPTQNGATAVTTKAADPTKKKRKRASTAADKPAETAAPSTAAPSTAAPAAQTTASATTAPAPFKAASEKTSKKRPRPSSPPPVASTSKVTLQDSPAQRNDADGEPPAKKQRKPRHKDRNGKKQAAAAQAATNEPSTTPATVTTASASADSRSLPAAASVDGTQLASVLEALLRTERGSAMFKPLFDSLEKRLKDSQAKESGGKRAKETADKQLQADVKSQSAEIRQLRTTISTLEARVSSLETELRSILTVVKGLSKAASGARRRAADTGGESDYSTASSVNASPSGLDRRLGKKERNLLRRAAEKAQAQAEPATAATAEPVASDVSAVPADEPVEAATETFRSRLASPRAFAAAIAAGTSNSTSEEGYASASSEAPAAIADRTASTSSEEEASDADAGQENATQVLRDEVMRDMPPRENDDLASSDVDDAAAADISTATTVILPENETAPARPSGESKDDTQPPSSQPKASAAQPVEKSKTEPLRTICDSSSAENSSSSSDDADSSSSETSDEPSVRNKPRASFGVDSSKAGSRPSLSQISTTAFAPSSLRRRSSIRPSTPSTRKTLIGEHEVDEAERELRRLSQTHVRVADLDETAFNDDRSKSGESERMASSDDDDDEVERERKIEALKKGPRLSNGASQRRRLSSSEPPTEDEETPQAGQAVSHQSERKRETEQALPVPVSTQAPSSSSPAKDGPTVVVPSPVPSDELLQSLSQFLPPKSASATPVNSAGGKSPIVAKANEAPSQKQPTGPPSSPKRQPVVEVETKQSASPNSKRVATRSPSPRKKVADSTEAKGDSTSASRGALSEIDEASDSEAEDQISPSLANREVNGTNQNDDAFKKNAKVAAAHPSSPQESQFVPLQKDKPLFLDDSASDPVELEPQGKALRSPRPAAKSAPPSASKRVPNGSVSLTQPDGQPVRRSTRRSASIEPQTAPASTPATATPSASQPAGSTAAAIGRSLRNVANGFFKGSPASSSSAARQQPPSSAPIATTASATGRSKRASGMPSLSQLDSLAMSSPASKAKVNDGTAATDKGKARNVPPKAKNTPSSQLSWVRKDKDDGSSDDDESSESD